jgi:hypothetical protein
MIGDRAVEGDVQTLGPVDDLLAPVGVDLAGKIDVQGHGVLRYCVD